MNIRLAGLKTGEYREVTKEEWEEISRLLNGNGRQPAR
jgi:23S rRNA pseudouridine2604 synthase/16S rRNA pseudouridine516 synthase